jgi:hypothetical protein
MKRHNAIALALLLALTGCSPQKPQPLQSKQAASGDWTLPYGEWSFSLSPQILPAKVLHVRVIDTDGYLYTFNTLDRLPVIQILSINGFSRSWRKRQFQQSQKPPQYIVFCWESYIDQQTYETSAVFGPDTWLRMKTPADHTWDGDPVWYDKWSSACPPAVKSTSGSRMLQDAPAFRQTTENKDPRRQGSDAL